MPGAGKLDRMVTVERFGGTANEFNEVVEGWSAFLTLRARRQDTSDVTKTEILGADQVGSFLLSHFTIRSSAEAKTITPADRLAYDGAVWNIKGVKETVQGRNRFIEISAVKDSG